MSYGRFRPTSRRAKNRTSLTEKDYFFHPISLYTRLNLYESGLSIQGCLDTKISEAAPIMRTTETSVARAVWLDRASRPLPTGSTTRRVGLLIRGYELELMECVNHKLHCVRDVLASRVIAAQ